jgi:hypothetical protein
MKYIKLFEEYNKNEEVNEGKLATLAGALLIGLNSFNLKLL